MLLPLILSPSRRGGPCEGAVGAGRAAECLRQLADFPVCLLQGHHSSSALSKGIKLPESSQHPTTFRNIGLIFFGRDRLSSCLFTMPPPPLS